MSRIPLSPRYAKMLLTAFQTDLMNYIIAIVSALTIQEVFILNQMENDSCDLRKKCGTVS